MDDSRPPDGPLVLRVTRRRHARLRVDMVLERATVPRGFRLLLAGAAAAGSAAAVAWGWPWVAMAIAWPATVLAFWWVRCGRPLRSGLGVGQSVSVEHVDGDLLRITDATGVVEVARGAAYIVSRWRGNVSIYTAATSFVLPGELVTDDHVAFMSEPSAEPAPAAAEGTSSLRMSAHVQDRLVRASTRVVATSADFVLPWVWASIAVVAAGIVASPTVVAVTALVAYCVASLGIEGVLTSRRAMRAAYPVGRTVRADVQPGHLVLSTAGVTRTTAWREYRSHRITSGTVVLRCKRRVLAPTRSEVLPIQLFDATAKQRLVAAVPRVH